MWVRSGQGRCGFVGCVVAPCPDHVGAVRVRLDVRSRASLAVERCRRWSSGVGSVDGGSVTLVAGRALSANWWARWWLE